MFIRRYPAELEAGLLEPPFIASGRRSRRAGQLHECCRSEFIRDIGAAGRR